MSNVTMNDELAQLKATLADKEDEMREIFQDAFNEVAAMVKYPAGKGEVLFHFSYDMTDEGVHINQNVKLVLNHDKSDIFAEALAYIVHEMFKKVVENIRIGQ